MIYVEAAGGTQGSSGEREGAEGSVGRQGKGEGEKQLASPPSLTVYAEHPGAPLTVSECVKNASSGGAPTLLRDSSR